MAIFRRLLKYTPAVGLGLLMLAWLAGFLGRFSITYSRSPGPAVSIESSLATLCFWHRSSVHALDELSMRQSGVHWRRFKKPPLNYQIAGTFKTTRHAVCMGGFVTGVQVPVPVVATACLPLAIGSLLSFRFRLWHYLAYTALVAVELAYYLRWDS